MVSQSMNGSSVTVAGYTGTDTSTSFLSVGPKFFETMQIPILLGRPVDVRDVTGAAQVAVVNEVFAKKFLPGQNPVGRRFTQGRGANAREYEIIGVARNARYHSLKNEIPAVVYQPYTHQARTMGSLTFVLRAAGDPMGLVGAAREIVRQA